MSEIELKDGPDPSQPFYIIGNHNLDGSIDIDSEGPRPFGTLAEALDNAQDMVDTYLGQQFIIECRVVKHLTPGDATVIKALLKLYLSDANLPLYIQTMGALIGILQAYEK